jgi:hypothetical protein
MKLIKDSNLLAEQVCMADIISAIETLYKHYYSKGDNDSVAENQAQSAIIRCLQWVVSFKIPRSFIAGRNKTE